MTHTPVRISTDAPVEVEREPLFYIDDVEYTIPKKIPANFVVRYLNDVYEHGDEYALAAAMHNVLGEDAMADLAASESVTDEHMDTIFDIVEKKLMSASAKTVGKSRNGRGRSRG